MSRFKKLRSHLSFAEAFRLYARIKTKKLDNISLSKLKHPFSLRKNPYDYYTFLEVVLQEAYHISTDFKPRCIIDGGGNIGLTAAYFATHHPEAEIVTLEPDQDNFHLLQKNTEAYPNIKAIQGGVWSRQAHLLVKDHGLGNNSITVEETAMPTPDTIEAWSISSIMDKMNWDHCDIVKLDVEGSEKKIFSENFEAWLPKTRMLIVELHDRTTKGSSKAVFSALNQYQFSLEIAGENLVFTNDAMK